jgi:DNA-binding CsgD family transcriptional regulator
MRDSCLGKNDQASHATRPRNPEDLFRLLIEQLIPTKLGQLSSPDPSAEDADEVVLDVELDGHRYVLVRTMKSTRVPIELSPREKEIVRMVAQGHPNKIIAGVLSISSWTVCTHLRRVFAKLGVCSRAAMVARLHELRSLGTRMPHTNLADSTARQARDTLKAARHKEDEVLPRRRTA